MSKVSRKPNSIGHNLTINLTQDILGVSSTGYVIRTSCFDELNLSNRPCALKRINTMDDVPPDLAHLSHENVVQLLHHWTEARDLFIVMELMDGDLAKLMARTKKARASPFSFHVAVDLMLQIAKGMLHVHEMGVSHPHLKCENILYKLTENKTGAYQVGDVLVKLGGFGCSRPADTDSKSRDVLCFGFMCLEILTGDEWSDDIFGAHMVPGMKVARSSIPETTPAILKDCIVRCLDTQTTFADVVLVLLRAKSYIMQTCKDEIIYSSESVETKIVQTKTNDYCAELSSTIVSNGGLEEIFTVHQLHPQLGDVSTAVRRATLIFFHGFHKVPEEWRRTWMTRDNKLVWPQKWLPEDLGAGNIRVLSVSFDANSNVSNNYNRYELGKNLVQKLVLSPRWKLGENDEAIFLVGHSFGGVLIKSLVAEARCFISELNQNNKDQQEVMKCEMFLKSLATTVFYSVPHAPTGLEFENYISECGNIVALQRSSFLQSLQEDTRFIADMNQLSAEFEINHVLSEKMKVLAFLEGKPMSKKRVLVTEKSCEGRSRSWEWHKIDKDNHFEVCRPDSKNHIGYRILLDHLQHYMNAPCDLTSTVLKVQRPFWRAIVFALLAIGRLKRHRRHSKRAQGCTIRQVKQVCNRLEWSRYCEECARIGSTDCIDHGGRLSEDTSVLGKRLGFRDFRRNWDKDHLVRIPLKPLTKRLNATSSMPFISDRDGFSIPSPTPTLVPTFFSSEIPPIRPAASVPASAPAVAAPNTEAVARPYDPNTPSDPCTEQGSTDQDNDETNCKEGGVRFRENLGKYLVEYRPPRFKWKLWMGTYATVDEGRRACDCARFYAGQDKGGFYFEDSPALFGELGPLNRPFSLVRKDVKDKAFNVELKKRAKHVIRKVLDSQSSEYQSFLNPPIPFDISPTAPGIYDLPVSHLNEQCLAAGYTMSPDIDGYVQSTSIQQLPPNSHSDPNESFDSI